MTTPESPPPAGAARRASVPSAARWLVALWAAVFAATALSRWATRSRLLFDFDEVNYVCALEGFSLVQSCPHPPGYLVYLTLGHAFRTVFPDPYTALLALSAASGAAAVLAVVLLARPWGATAWIAGGFLFTSPLMWAYGGLALPFATELAVSAAIGLLAWRVLRGPDKGVACAFLLGLGTGVRFETLVLLGPLLLYAIVRSGKARRLPVVLAAGAVGVLLWFVPLLLLSGGWSEWRFLQAEKWEADLRFLSLAPWGWSGVPRHLRYGGRALLWSLGGALALAGLLTLRGGRPRPGSGRWAFLGVWAIPGLVWWLFLFRAEHPGHVAIVVPPLLLGLGLVAQHALEQRRTITAVAISGGLLISSALFVGARTIQQTPFRPLVCDKCAEYSRQGMLYRAEVTEAIIRTVERYDPTSTAVLTYHFHGAQQDYFRQLGWYLPGYPVYFVPLQGEGYSLMRDRATSVLQEQELDLRGVDTLVFAGDAPHRFLPEGIELVSPAPDVWLARVPPGAEVVRFAEPFVPDTGVRLRF